MTIMMIMVVIGMMMKMKIIFLSGTMVIKNKRFKKHKLRKTFYPFPGSHQDTGTGVCQKMKNKRQKNCGGKYRPFLWEKYKILSRQELIPTRRGTSGWSGPKDEQDKTDKFLSFFGVMYVIVNSKKDKGNALKGLMQELKRSRKNINKPSNRKM